MILTKDNSEATIIAALTGRFKHLTHYDPKMQRVFNIAPCDTCGTMLGSVDYVTIEKVSGPLNAALHEYYQLIDYVEYIGYDEETGEEVCEKCE